MPEAKQIQDNWPADKFDLRVQQWDARGRVKSVNPYRVHNQAGATYFERPVNSGNLWYEDNTPAGRVTVTRNEKGAIISKKFDHNAPHIAYSAPLSAEEQTHYENETLKAENAKLAAELAAIRSEQDKRAEAASTNQITEDKAEAKAQRGGGSGAKG